MFKKIICWFLGHQTEDFYYRYLDDGDTLIHCDRCSRIYDQKNDFITYKFGFLDYCSGYFEYYYRHCRKRLGLKNRCELCGKFGCEQDCLPF